jgi:ADP-glucose pyrophosphorylase
MGGCHIEENVVIKDSILGRNVRIGSGSVLRHAVIGDDMIIESDRKVIDSRIPHIE